MVRFMRFPYYKTANRTAPLQCCTVRYGVGMPFYERFRCDFYDFCGLCGLINNRSSKAPKKRTQEHRKI